MKILIFIVIMGILNLSAVAQEVHFKTSDSVDLYVKVAGKGTPCLYIHGGPGSGSYWVEKFAGDILEQNMQIIYVDQRGVGRSSSPANGDFSPGRIILDFEEIRKSLGIKQWLTMGHSFAGVIQIKYALENTDVIKGMLMINCALYLHQEKEVLQKAYELINEPEYEKYLNDSIPVDIAINKLYSRLRKKKLFWKMGYAEQSSEEKMTASFREIPKWNKDYENKAMSYPEVWIDYRPQTEKLEIPVLFFYGKTDWMVGPNNYKGVNFPNMILWGSDVGHVPFIENKPDLEKAIKHYLSKYKF
jgi:proline iminopeptidase